MFNPLSIIRKPKAFAYRCACCGKKHIGAPSFSVAQPFLCHDVPKDEFSARVTLDSDLCIIDGSQFFIRATLTIPIHNSPDGFVFGDWVSQSAESFKAYSESLGQDQSGQSSFGWWPVTSAAYWKAGEPAAMLKSHVIWQKKGTRPIVILDPEETHPLAIDQSNGISWDKAAALATKLMHPEAP